MFNLISLKGGLSNVKGFFCGGLNIGLKKDGANDVAFIRSDVPCKIAYKLTSNKFQAAPLKHLQEYPKDFETNFIFINTKNANAMTGIEGIEDVKTVLEVLKKTKTNILNPIMSSTGVIGQRLDVEKITKAFEKFDFNSKDSDAAAHGIMTTDRFKKEICFRVELPNQEPFHIAAICKGAGMINPALATMLCFIVTDASISKSDMNESLSIAIEDSFNKVSVDGDTSTNDSVFLLSNSASNSYDKDAFLETLKRVTHYLALELVRDGEGATKVVAFDVYGAASNEQAKKAAKALSNSLLVKTALFGEDPNWGRIASTIGASGIDCNEELLEIYYDDLLIYGKNQKQMSQEVEEKAKLIMKKDSFCIKCNIGIGDGKYKAYGCDLGHQYVNINADYRS